MTAPRFSRRRIDHRPNYLWLMASFVIIAVILPWHFSYVGTAHAALNSSLADVMAATLGIFSALCLFGAASGTPRFRPVTDLRDAYAIQTWSIIPVCVAAGVFDYGLWVTREDWQMAILVAAIIIGLLWNSRDFHIEARRLTEELVRRVSEGTPV